MQKNLQNDFGEAEKMEKPEIIEEAEGGRESDVGSMKPQTQPDNLKALKALNPYKEPEKPNRT